MLLTCVLVFVSKQRAALLKGFFTNVTSVKPFIGLLQSLPPWSSIQSVIHEREVVQSAAA